MAKRVLPIEKLLQWAYGEQRVHLNLEGNGSSQVVGDGDGSGFCMAVVDGSHTDALTLDLLVSGLQTGPLVRKFGIAGTQPNWRPDARHRIEAKQWEVGRSTRWAVTLTTVRMADFKERRQGAIVNEMGAFPYCEVVEVDAPYEIEGQRAIYSDWVAGLTALRDTLTIHSDSLVDYAVSQVLPPMRPWENPKTQRILIAENRSLTTG